MRVEDFAVLFEGVPRGNPDAILAESLREVAENPTSYYHLVRLANAYWRIRDWAKAIEFAQRAIDVDSESFHARKILVQGHAELEQHDACYDHSRKLLSTCPTDWGKAKRFPWYLRPLAILPRPRTRLNWWREQCDLEARSDEGMLAFAKGFIAWYEHPAREQQPNLSLERTRR